MTTYEMYGREKKVAKIVAAMDLISYSSDQVAKIDHEGWKRAAEVMEMNPPSEATIKAVICKLREHEGRCPNLACDAPAATELQRCQVAGCESQMCAACLTKCWYCDVPVCSLCLADFAGHRACRCCIDAIALDGADMLKESA